MIRRTFIRGLLITLALGFLLAALLPMFTSLNWIRSFSIVGGSLFVFFVPGFLWSFFIWPFGTITKLERCILAIFLSLVMVPLLLFVANKLGLPVRLSTTMLVTVIFSLAGLVIQMRSIAKAWKSDFHS